MLLPKTTTLSLFTAIVISLMLVPIIAIAAEADTAGNCAANVTKTIADLKERKTTIEKSLTDSASAKRLADFESQLKTANNKVQAARQKYLDGLDSTLKNDPNFAKDPTPNTPLTELDVIQLSKTRVNSQTSSLFNTIELKKFVEGVGINKGSSWLTQLVDGLKKQETIRKSESQKIINKIDAQLVDLEVLAQARKIANEVGIYPNGCFYLLKDGTIGVRVTRRNSATLSYAQWETLYNKFTQALASQLGSKFKTPIRRGTTTPSTEIDKITSVTKTSN